MEKQIKLINIKSNGDFEEFWKQREEYLFRDIFPNDTIGTQIDEEQRAWLLSEEYKNHVDRLSNRQIDRLHLVFFEQDGAKIGFCTYCTYFSEDGKCFIINFCIYPEFRGQGFGKQCFNALEEKQYELGAKYFELNVSNEDNKGFWNCLGFQYNGYDEYGAMLCQLPPRQYSEFKCELFNKEDFWQLSRLSNGYKAEIGEGFLEDKQKEALKKAIEDEDIYFFVVKHKIRVVAMCSVSITFSTFKCERSGVFEDFYIEPVYRKKGIAIKLINFVYKWCEGKKVSSLWVGCTDSDVEMYKSLGFKIPLGNLLTWSNEQGE